MMDNRKTLQADHGLWSSAGSTAT